MGLPTDVLAPVDSKFIVIVSVCLAVKRRRKNLLSLVGECLDGTVNGVCVEGGKGGFESLILAVRRTLAHDAWSGQFA